MRHSLRPCAGTARGTVDVRANQAPPPAPTTRAVSVLPLAMTALFIWGVILPLELAVRLLGSS
jgi:hypothetical protein